MEKCTKSVSVKFWDCGNTFSVHFSHISIGYMSTGLKGEIQWSGKFHSGPGVLKETVGCTLLRPGVVLKRVHFTLLPEGSEGFRLFVN